MSELEKILVEIQAGSLDTADAARQIERLFFTDLGHTKIDTDRKRRTGCSEVIYCGSKRADQIREIVNHLVSEGQSVLGTRMSAEIYAQIKDEFPDARYDENSRLFTIGTGASSAGKGTIAVVSAGTSDSLVAEEAAGTAEFYGHTVERIYDAGVAGIHRLLSNLESIRSARVVIAVAGMEGALASVVGGLVDAPVIAVPTSVGYGANYQGLSALLAMLNSCASGISVVNIDNGFGAGYLAAMINSM
jgi:NCAIR mutase (PurE)-related protein